MKLHVLPGDSLTADFQRSGIEGEVVVCRECLVVGDLTGETLEEFWDTRSNFMAVEYGGDPIEYREHVAYELERLIDLSAEDEVSLWFEYELFCQTNMWFCLDLLKGTAASVYRVEPLNTSPDDVWKGFGSVSPEGLAECYESRTQCSKEDVDTGSALWAAFRDRDPVLLRQLGDHRSPCFPFLKEVCEAAADIDSRPADIVRELKAMGLKKIDSLFPEFQKRAGVYGFGDLQVQRLLEML
ncbi:MAG: DUF1835 domain-containing protein [Acidobacteriota bacterium]